MIECTVRPLADEAAFLTDWSNLYARADHQGFFLSPPWMRAWLGGKNDRDSLTVLKGLMSGGAILLGVACGVRRRPPLIGLQECWLHEFGDAARDAVYVEYNDFLVSSDAPPSTRAEAAHALLDALSGVDGLVVRNARLPLFAAFSAAAKEKGLSLRVLREQPIYATDLRIGQPPSEMSQSLRARLRKTLSVYDSRGPVTGEIVTTGPEFEEAWRELEALHEARWNARGEKGAFANPQLIAFHRRLNEAAPGCVQLFRVKAGGETVGVLYNFLWNGRAMNYQSGFRFEEDAKISPGYLTHVMAAEHYRKQGVAIYDYLAGDDDYKARLGEQESVLTSFVVERESWRRNLRQLVRR